MFLFVQNYFMTGNNLFMCEYDSRGWDTPPPFKIISNVSFLSIVHVFITLIRLYFTKQSTSGVFWGFFWGGGSVFYGFFYEQMFYGRT